VGKFTRLREHIYILEMLTIWAKYAIYDRYWQIVENLHMWKLSTSLSTTLRRICGYRSITCIYL